MRAGRVATIAGVACLASACGAPAGVAGLSTLPPASPAVASPTSTGDGVATAATAGPSPLVAVVRPQGHDPVRLPPPKVSRFDYTFPIKGCRSSYARKLLVLPKTTIWAKKGCLFVSPVDGVVKEVNVKNLWAPSTDKGADREGRFVTVLGEDGVLYLGGHLDSVDPTVRPGMKVRAGQRLGRVGNSGNARDTASNLYFAISWPVPSNFWWVRRGMVEPWDYLDAWFDGNRTLSPRKTVLALRKRVGALPTCALLCTSKAVAVKQKPKNNDNDSDLLIVSPD